MTFSPDNLEKRKAYLSPRFFESLKSAPPVADPFTRTSDLPKAFRVGACTVIEPDRRVTFNVLLFWKTDTRTEQRPISVEMENAAGRWLIGRVDDVSGSD